MSELVEHLYFNWLCAKVVNMKEADQHPYWKLFTQLHRTEFVWLISGDDNRAEDGKELRREFILAADLPDDPEWRIVLGCSVFEMLIAFARRAEFQDETPTQEWFWEFLHNLKLDEFDNEHYDNYAIENILQHFIWRMYGSDGDGGLFPIMNPQVDQKETEIWYQFCEYLVDQGRLP